MSDCYHRDGTPFTHTSESDLPAYLEEFRREFELDRKVASDVIECFGEKITVSTVFLVLDHAFGMGNGEPYLFETMVFGGLDDEAMFRYHNESDALTGHTIIVTRLREHGTLDDTTIPWDFLAGFFPDE